MHPNFFKYLLCLKEAYQYNKPQQSGLSGRRMCTCSVFKRFFRLLLIEPGVGLDRESGACIFSNLGSYLVIKGSDKMCSLCLLLCTFQKMNRLDILPSFLCPLNNDKGNSLLTRKPGIAAPTITLGCTAPLF